MLKKISNLNGAKKLNKVDLKAIAGEGSRATVPCNTDFDCEQTGLYCPGQSRCLSSGGCIGVPASGGC